MALLSDSPVPYEILRDPRPTYSGGPDGRRATVHFLVAIDDVTAFIQFVIHSVELVDHGGGVTSERVVPLVYPDDTQMHLIAYDIEYGGTPNQGGVSMFADQFSYARIACEFGVLPFSVGGDTPYFTLTTDHAPSMETLPGSALAFPSGAGTTGEFALRVGTVAYTLTTFLGTTPVSPTISNLSGKVNAATFTVQGIGTFPAGTLRLNGIRSDYAVGMFSRTMTKQFLLLYRERSWQQVMNDVGVWETPTLVGTGLNKYETANFELLKSA